jgi:hypothetical protein
MDHTFLQFQDRCDVSAPHSAVFQAAQEVHRQAARHVRVAQRELERGASGEPAPGGLRGILDEIRDLFGL